VGLAQQVNQIYNATVNGAGVVVTKYPINAVGVALKGSGSTTGAYKFAAAGANVAQILAKATITVPWRIVAYSLTLPSAPDIFVVRLGAGTGAGAVMTAILWESEIDLDATFSLSLPIPIPWGASPTVQPNGTTDAIVADLANEDATDRTANISLTVVTGMGS